MMFTKRLGFHAPRVSACLGVVLGCSPLAKPADAPPAPKEVPLAGVLAEASSGRGLVVPERIEVRASSRRRIASGLNNPRGMLPTPRGLLVATAGTGDPKNPNSGALLRLSDENGDGDFDDEGERTVLLGGQPSTNIVHIVRRDEVFGLADVAEGGGDILVTLAFFGGPSTVFRVEGDKATPAATIHGNLNDIAFDPRRREWFGVSSSSDEILKFALGGRGDRVAKLSPLSKGQDPVPGYIQADPLEPGLLVTLFSGSTKGEAGGEGIELETRAGSIVRIDPETGAMRPVVDGLTAPTDLLALSDGTLYVLEFCDAFLEPLESREQFEGPARHGGFRRFSGRLLRIDRHSGEVLEIASGLDGPTNLALSGDRLLVSQGMGTPGRRIPTKDGERPLEGFIEEIALR